MGVCTCTCRPDRCMHAIFLAVKLLWCMSVSLQEACVCSDNTLQEACVCSDNTHTHTHQHSTPSATAPSLVDDCRQSLHSYLMEKMHTVAPYLSSLIGEIVGARLIR